MSRFASLGKLIVGFPRKSSGLVIRQRSSSLRLMSTKEQENRSWFHFAASWLSEMKMFVAVTIAIVSWWSEMSVSRKQARKQLELTAINQQIRELYGPLYGNRLVRHKTFESALGGYPSVTDYLEEAERRKDARMIRRWRSYVINVLHPLDQKAESLILTNAHLIVSNGGEFPEEFEKFLERFARFKFLMQMWMNERGLLENCVEFEESDFAVANNRTLCDDDHLMLGHVTKRYDDLRKRQRRLQIEDSDDKTTLSSYLMRSIKGDD